jgi:hypothetical protein
MPNNNNNNITINCKADNRKLTTTIHNKGSKAKLKRHGYNSRAYTVTTLITNGVN